MANDDTSWRTTTFRQSVVAKIDEAIKQSGMPTSKNSAEMENHVFQKAKSREEYLSFVARLILHVREMNSKKGGAGMNPQAQGGPGMPDPINALQNLASQGTRNNQMMGMAGPQGPNAMAPNTATNLLQTLNQRPVQGLQNIPGLQNKMQGMPMGPGNVQMGNQMPNQIPNQMNQQIPGQNIGQMQNQMANQLQGPLANQLQNQGPMGNQINPQMNVPNQIQNLQSQLVNQMPNQMMNPMHNMQQRKPGEGMMMNPNTVGFQGPRTVTPNQYMRQSPTPSAHSPAGMSAAPPSNQMNQMVPSPALVPSPSPQMAMMNNPQRSVGMAPSPGSSLNTPGQAVPTPSPLGMQEEQAYRDKVRQLSKYIEPLRKMIARMGNDGEHVEKLSKMKKLLEILSNPSKRMPLETLLKCEVVLEKMDLKRGEGGSVPTSSSTQLAALKEHYIFNPLIESINNCLQSAVFNHTLQRSFGPSTEALNGPEIKGMPAPLKRRKNEEPTSDIPDVLQGEIARLDSRFKVSLDPIQQSGSRTVQLICWLDDRNLPCVPPINVSIPEDYPKNPPSCNLASHEYNATTFLISVQKALLLRISKLPKKFSVSQLLDTWEMSVRQACAPVQVPMSSVTVLMGL